jgi:hypothetical protein
LCSPTQKKNLTLAGAAARSRILAVGRPDPNEAIRHHRLKNDMLDPLPEEHIITENREGQRPGDVTNP